MQLVLEKVSKVYRGGVRALSDFQLELQPGVLGLLGPNGAGKSTLMRILATITRATSGRDLWNGADIALGLGGLALAWDIAQHLFLPALTLALFYMAVYARMTRAAMLDVAQMDFVKTARAKGVKPGRILRAHVLRNALLPVVTLAGIQAGGMIGGAVLTETVFAWPGIGRLMFDALLQFVHQFSARFEAGLGLIR